MTTVLDASFAVHVGAEAGGDALVSGVSALILDGLTAPAIFWHEVASALRNMRLRGLITEPAMNASLRGLGGFGVVLEPASSDIRPVMAVSERYQLTIYDAAYLELALRAGSRLATRDRGLRAAAARAGVESVG